MTDLVKLSDYPRDEIALIKQTVAKDATDLELAMFLHRAKTTGLDPMARQIHFVKRGGEGIIQVGIDGLRLIAERTGQYVGNDEAHFDLDDEGKLIAAHVTVWKMVSGIRCPYSAFAYWDEYRPEKGDWMWRKMPRNMLAKCAESQALRKAFPQETSGIYTHEEMDQADARPVNVTADGEIVTPAPKVTLGTTAKVKTVPLSGFICENCEQPIEPAQIAGQMRTPEYIAYATKRKFRMQLCADCGRKAQAELDEKARKAAQEAALPPMADDDGPELPTPDPSDIKAMRYVE